MAYIGADIIRSGAFPILGRRTAFFSKPWQRMVGGFPTLGKSTRKNGPGGVYDMMKRMRVGVVWCLALAPLVWTTGCRSPSAHREQVDAAATARIERGQAEWLERDTPFTIERPADTLRRRLLAEQALPSIADDVPALDDEAGGTDTEPLVIDLNRALMIGAANHRDYQERKEDIFRAALNLDVEHGRFRETWQGTLEATYSDDRAGDENERGVVGSAAWGVGRTLRTGAELSTRLAFDLVQLLSLDRDSAYGVLADVSVQVPLLRGAGRAVVTEPLTQAERDVMYAMFNFELFKARYAVRVATEYLQVLQQLDQVRNAQDNFERVAVSARRARRLAEAGRLPEIQVDQAQQEELRARDRWLSAHTTYARRLDQFKVTLGLPADAQVELDGQDLQRLRETLQDEVQADVEALTEDVVVRADAPVPVPAAREERMDAADAIRIALDQRFDLQVAVGRIHDAERGLVVARDALRPAASLTAGGRAGSRRGLGNVGQGDARLDPAQGRYDAGLELELPWSRFSQRAAYRDQYIAVDRARRRVEALEDEIKGEIRQSLRVWTQARESMAIQARSVELAQRRVDSTELFLQAGRAQIRDVLEAQEAWVSARDALSAAVVAYRLAELELQRDMGVLAVDDEGLWQEYTKWSAEQ